VSRVPAEAGRSIRLRSTTATRAAFHKAPKRMRGRLMCRSTLGSSVARCLAAVWFALFSCNGVAGVNGRCMSGSELGRGFVNFVQIGARIALRALPSTGRGMPASGVDRHRVKAASVGLGITKVKICRAIVAAGVRHAVPHVLYRRYGHNGAFNTAFMSFTASFKIFRCQCRCRGSHRIQGP